MSDRYQLELYLPTHSRPLRIGDYSDMGEALDSARDTLRFRLGYHPDYTRVGSLFEFRNPNSQQVVGRIIPLR